MVLINPADFTIPSTQDINVYGYLLAPDRNTADEVADWSQYSKDYKTHNHTTGDLNRQKVSILLFTIISLLDHFKENYFFSHRRKQ